MKAVAYSHWQALIRLPVLCSLAVWIRQRGRLSVTQTQFLVSHLDGVRHREGPNLLGQLADDSLSEYAALVSELAREDFTHFPLQCARVLTAAEAEMDEAELTSFLNDHLALLTGLWRSRPWYRKVLALRSRAPAKDPLRELRGQLTALLT